MGLEFQFCKMKRVLEKDGGDGCTTMLIYLMPLHCTLKKIVKTVNLFLFYYNFKNTKETPQNTSFLQNPNKTQI